MNDNKTPRPAEEVWPEKISEALGKSNRRQFIQRATMAAAGLSLSPYVAVSCAPNEPPLAFENYVEIQTQINGEAMKMKVDPRTSLLDLLREQLGLTGTKKGCNQGACGACTVHLDNMRINSCLTLAVQIDGFEVTTIEGLSAGDTLHPVQAAFIEHDGFQCGYCTSGQIMSAVMTIQQNHAQTPEEIQEWMSGNICRCGAYRGIVAAAEAARDAMKG